MNLNRVLSIFKIYFRGYLSKTGWVKSVISGLPQDNRGNALPWFNYPAINFIKPRLNKDFVVFEFGSGNSTIWFSNSVSAIYSVEHDKKWFEIMNSKIRGITNVNYSFRSLENSEYAKEVLKYSNLFDVIIIDGRDRINCCYNSLAALKNNGIIIWDNSEREKYNEGYDFLASKGFKRLDFHGLGPINSYEWGTTIFYRANNCFNI